MECLITKLKATVNNPNLPIIERMQQFTLDAIAASGNGDNMTNEQKMALNHFFYQIGAIGNTGIWTKMKVLFMPMIASDAAHAMVDYKTNIAGYSPQANTSFDSTNKCLQRGKEDLQLAQIDSISDTDFSVVTLNPDTSSTTNRPSAILVANSDDTIKFIVRNGKTSNNFGSKEIIEGSNTSYGVRYLCADDTTTYRGYAINIDNSTPKAGYVILPTSGLIELQGSVSESRYSGVNINNADFYLGANYMLQAISLGTALTNDETYTLITAMMDLRSAFVVSE